MPEWRAGAEARLGGGRAGAGRSWWCSNAGRHRQKRETERESERGGECGNSAERGGARVGGRLEQMDVGLALSFCASLWITG